MFMDTGSQAVLCNAVGLAFRVPQSGEDRARHRHPLGGARWRKHGQESENCSWNSVVWFVRDFESQEKWVLGGGGSGGPSLPFYRQQTEAQGALSLPASQRPNFRGAQACVSLSCSVPSRIQRRPPPCSPGARSARSSPANSGPFFRYCTWSCFYGQVSFKKKSAAN